ncbi:MAG: hypothetical protein FWG73_03260 [Planctomycetaceae bacterium]|nr:hypothetical protein [Planctomycetaceae bacterium]
MTAPQNGQPVDVSGLQAEFEALYIPKDIDPTLLALWIEREQHMIKLKEQRGQPPPPPKTFGRSLSRLFPAYIGIAVMCFSIILGVLQGKEPTLVLQIACIAFLVYTVIGFFVGIVAEYCVTESVETLLRDVVKRSRESAKKE